MVCSNDESRTVYFNRLSELLTKSSTTSSDVDAFMTKHHLTRDSFINCQIDFVKGYNLEYPVHAAIKTGRIDLLQTVFQFGFLNIDSLLYWLTPAFHYSCAKGIMSVVKSLVEEHSVDVDAPDSSTVGNAPVLWAVLNGQMEALKYLLEKGACPFVINSFEESPLHLSAIKGHSQVCRYLLLKGADVNQRDQSGSTPLHHTTCVDTARVLLTKGADPNILNNLSETAFHTAVRQNNLELIDLLVSFGSEATFPMNMSLNESHFDTVRYIILNTNVPLNHSLGGESLMQNVLRQGYPPTVDLLLAAGYHPTEGEFFKDGCDVTTYSPLQIGLLKRIRTQAKNPRNLAEIACFKIRNTLGVNPSTAIDHFQIPVYMKNYLKLLHVYDFNNTKRINVL